MLVFALLDDVSIVLFREVGGRCRSYIYFVIQAHPRIPSRYCIYSQLDSSSSASSELDDAMEAKGGRKGKGKKCLWT